MLPEWLCDGHDDCIHGDDELPENCPVQQIKVKGTVIVISSNPRFKGTLSVILRYPQCKDVNA